MKYFLSIVVLLSLTITNFAHAKEHHKSSTAIKTVKVTEDIYMLQGEGGNIGILRGQNKTIIIDSQFSHVAKQVKGAISAISDKPISFLLNTHFHFDHAGGNAAIASAGANIIAHENVRNKLKNGSYIKAFDKNIEPAKAEELPVLTYKSGIKLYENGEEIELLHYPKAHTNGDTAVFFETSNVIHTGDLYFNGFYPFIDISNGGSVDGVIKAMQAIIARADENTKIIPGHGALSNKSKMSKDLQMLQDISAAVKQAIADGKDKKAIVKLEAIQKYIPAYGGGFLPTEKFIDIIYSDYK